MLVLVWKWFKFAEWAQTTKKTHHLKITSHQKIKCTPFQNKNWYESKTNNKHNVKLWSLHGLYFSSCTIETCDVDKMRTLDASNEYYLIKENDGIESNNRSYGF